MAALVPFTINVAQDILDHIQARCALSRVGYAPADDNGWRYGTDAAWLAGLLDYWRNMYDWRAAERRLNRWPHFKAEIDGLSIHFLHARAPGPVRRPLLLTHGWPGSFFEFDAAIAPLTAAGYDVIIPSLPGYAFSSRPAAPLSPRQIAALWRQLMVDVLGHQQFFAQGGDWGAVITTWLGRDHADVVAAIHLNTLMLSASLASQDAATLAWRARAREVRRTEAAYIAQQSTKPQTIGLALADSPLGFAAWVTEKFHGWGDTRGDIESRFSKDQLLTNIMLYLVNDAVPSAIWLYRSILAPEARDLTYVKVPTGLALFPGDYMPIPPRQAAERLYNVARWTEMPAGGHFAAMEEPAAFAREVTAFFSSLPPGPPPSGNK